MAALAVVFAAFAGTGPAWAQAGSGGQPVEDLSVYEGRPIREIRLLEPIPDKPNEYGPLEKKVDQLVRNQLRVREGMPYDQKAISQDMARINRLGRFSKLETRVQLLDDGSVVLSYVLVEQPIIVDVQVVGNRAVTDQEIAAAMPLLPGTPVDQFQLGRAARIIENLYRTKGFYLAQVSVDEKELAETGIVLFVIREGERVKVTSVRFQGNDSFPDKRLRSVIETKPSGLFKTGPLDNDTLDRDVAALIDFYRDRGHLDVRTDREFRISPNGREAIVTFLIEEGPVYTLQDVQVQYVGDGEPASGLFTREQAIGLMSIKPGDVYSINRLTESVGAIRSALGQMGYVDVQVRRREIRNLREPRVSLLLVINPGRRYYTGEVIIQGNELTRQNVIRRQVRVKPGRPLDQTALDETESRLRRTRLFDQRDPDGVSVSVQNPQPPSPGLSPIERIYRDVLIEVKETNTGDFSFGASVGSDLGVAASISLTQRNFDITDVPDSFGEFLSGRAFRGGGQTFSIQALPGDRIETYAISLSDPAVLDTDYSASASLFYRQADFPTFNEERFGTRGSVGRRFGTRWGGAVTFRGESVTLTDLDADQPVDVFDVADRKTVVGVGLDFSRTTVDSRTRPSRGSRLEFGIEEVVGDFTFTKFRIEHTVFLPIREDFQGRRTILSLKTRVNYIPQSKDEVPIYERFFQGGQNFRGFDFRTIAPVGIRHDTGEPGNDPVGGTWSFFWGAEIRQPVFGQNLAVVGFMDTGTVVNTPGFKNYRISVGTGIRLFVPQLSPVPLAFDLAIPLLEEDTDDDRAFSFTLDLPF